MKEEQKQKCICKRLYKLLSANKDIFKEKPGNIEEQRKEHREEREGVRVSRRKNGQRQGDKDRVRHRRRVNREKT